MTSPLSPERRDSKQDGEQDEACEAGPRASGVSQLSPALLRSITEQLFSHRHQLGRHERRDLLGARYGWTREVPDVPMPVEPVEPAGLDA